jgi:uncharacterized protein YdaT
MIFRRWTVLWELQNNKSKNLLSSKNLSTENIHNVKSNTNVGIRSLNMSRGDNCKMTTTRDTEDKTRSLINYNKERHKFVRENNANNAVKREAKFNLKMQKRELKEQQ